MENRSQMHQGKGEVYTGRLVGETAEGREEGREKRKNQKKSAATSLFSRKERRPPASERKQRELMERSPCRAAV